MFVGEPFTTELLKVSGYVAVIAPVLLHGAGAKTFVMTVYRRGHRFDEMWRLVAGVGVVAMIWVRTDGAGFGVRLSSCWRWPMVALGSHAWLRGPLSGTV